METLKKGTNVFLVLVPHRDIRVALRKFSETLDIKEVYPFPWVAPLAVLSKPLKADELKQIAASLRNRTEKFCAKEPLINAFPAGKDSLSLLGTSLNLEIEPDIINKLRFMEVIKNPVVGMYLIPKNNTKLLREIPVSVKNVPKLSFRAAAAANMYFCKKSEDTYLWKIDKLYWLPKGES